MLRFVLTRCHARVSLPVGQHGLRDAEPRTPAVRRSVAVEEREVARRENLFGVVFAQIRRRVGISEREAKFLFFPSAGLTCFTSPCAAAAFICNSARNSIGVIPSIFLTQVRAAPRSYQFVPRTQTFEVS
jgi:hypothetical protein